MYDWYIRFKTLISRTTSSGRVCVPQEINGLRFVYSFFVRQIKCNYDNNYIKDDSKNILTTMASSNVYRYADGNHKSQLLKIMFNMNEKPFHFDHMSYLSASYNMQCKFSRVHMVIFAWKVLFQKQPENIVSFNLIPKILYNITWFKKNNTILPWKTEINRVEKGETPKSDA